LPGRGLGRFELTLQELAPELRVKTVGVAFGQLLGTAPDLAGAAAAEG
jgi:hypothetical protein